MFPGDRVEISGPGGGPVEHAVAHRIDIASLEPEQRQQLKETLVALKAKQIDQEAAGLRAMSRPAPDLRQCQCGYWRATRHFTPQQRGPLARLSPCRAPTPSLHATLPQPQHLLETI